MNKTNKFSPEARARLVPGAVRNHGIPGNGLARMGLSITGYRNSIGYITPAEAGENRYRQLVSQVISVAT